MLKKILFLLVFLKTASSVWANSSFIFADPVFRRASNQFSPNQSIYIRLDTQAAGSDRAVLQILDAAKKPVQSRNLAPAELDPGVYQAVLTAPAAAGIYYLDFKASGPGFSFAAQENIQVGSGDQSPVAVEVQAQSRIGNFEPAVPLSPAPSPVPTAESGTAVTTEGWRPAEPVPIGPLAQPTAAPPPGVSTIKVFLSDFFRKLSLWLARLA
ncbi:MAG: hypothetical protein JW991_04015 [Candidatus Pacebacteria bacterium]|nr:hypothetical protein [Candidatus Paceibacterota bacterium]